MNHVTFGSGTYRTALLIAVEFNRLKVVEEFLSKGADINQAEESGTTPMGFAALRGHVMPILVPQRITYTWHFDN